MLRWSDEPLEIDLEDPKSPARRLPPAELEWLECTHATLLVPVTTPAGASRSLIAVMALGPKRSDQPYTAEDRQVLASIAAQISLALDVARLRSRASETETPTGMVASAEALVALLVECSKCGRCEDASTPNCPNDGTAMATLLPIPRVIDSKYRIDQVVGRGGMGAVYRARDLRLDRDVAIKVVRAELLGDPEARTRFRREAQIVARLQHPAVVSIFDYGTLPDGGAYLVMELVRGTDLREALKQNVRFSPDSAIRLMTSVCSAIEAAHKAGILHRDLKPENILLPQGDVDVKVLDFGVAKLVARDQTAMATGMDQETLTVHGQIIGTPAYMAPEQLRGGAVDSRTDVFSLGVIAYELLTGNLPFGKGPMVDIAMRHATGAAPLAGAGQPVGEGLDTAVRRALSLDPNERPSSPMAFATALQAAVGVS
jgi:tRNA A-37 threonylcarbamoyl transferase component Bud32